MYRRNNPTTLVDENGREIKLHTAHKYYQAHGQTAAAAIQNTQKVSGLRDNAGHPMIGNTHVKMGVSIKTATVETKTAEGGTGASANATVKTADVNLNVATTLPQWAEHNSTSPEEQKQWDDSLAKLKSHEDEHSKIALEGAHDLDKSLPSTSGSGTGGTESEAANAAVNDMAHYGAPCRQ